MIQFKFFEINIRLGRSNFYITGSGFNTVKLIVDDLIYNKEIPYTIADKENLFKHLFHLGFLRFHLFYLLINL